MTGKVAATIALLGAVILAAHLAGGARAAPKAQPGTAAPAKIQPARDRDAIPDPVREEMTRTTMPGPLHRALEGFAGSWITRTRVWEKPEATALEYRGTGEYRMIMGGRYLRLESSSTLGDQQSHGLGLFGYDAFKERYTFYFIHDGDTQALAGLGTPDSTGREITFEVTMDMPSSGERAKPIRAVLRRLSPDRHVFEMHEKYVDGREWMVLEIAYERTR